MENALSGIRIGFAMTGSFCTFQDAFIQIKKLRNVGADIFPILSYHAATLDTRFMKAQELKEQLRNLTQNDIIVTIPEAEPIGPQKKLDVAIVLPCTGNSLAKIANGITDTPVTLAVKAHLRNERPVVIGLSTNDGLASSAKNIGALLNIRNIYFVPFYQDDPIQKHRSLMYNGELILETISEALKGKQIQPVLHR
jgi:dipicolinate synthase subunit B